MIQYYTENDRQSWDDYVMCSKGTTFFHLIGWKDVVESIFNYTSYYLMAKEGENIQRERVRFSRISNIVRKVIIPYAI